MSGEATSLIYRWVDAKTARSYMRIDAMVGRTRHWLPKELTGLDKIYRKRGLSFAMRFGKWMCSTTPIGFAVDPDAIDNRIARIDGHEVYLFSDAMQMLKGGVPCRDEVLDHRYRAIERSLGAPDEAFVIGDIRGLSSAVREVVVRDEHSQNIMSTWCRDHGIPMRRH